MYNYRSKYNRLQGLRRGIAKLGIVMEMGKKSMGECTKKGSHFTASFLNDRMKEAGAYFFMTAASSMNFFRPLSVSGWLASCLMTEYGMVAISAPIIAASTTCWG